MSDTNDAASLEQQSRKEFEEWIQSPPIEKSVVRFGSDWGSGWQGQYHSYEVQLAWESWQKAREKP